MGAEISEGYIDAGGVSTFVRRRRGEGTPTVFLHGVPTNSADWLPFMERLRGPAVAPDLPCFGRSGRPSGGEFDPTMHGYGEWVGRFVEAEGIDRYRLVVHDWGVVGLLAAMREPERVERLVVMNAVPLLPGYRWHWVARLWRRRAVGEFLNATSTESTTRMLIRQARPGFKPAPDGFIEAFWPHWDRGTKRAVLRLYRSADPDVLAAAGLRLGEIRCPALVVWGQNDAYLPSRFGRAFADRLPNSELVELEPAGHWPWLEQPSLLQRVAAFLEA